MSQGTPVLRNPNVGLKVKKGYLFLKIKVTMYTLILVKVVLYRLF